MSKATEGGSWLIERHNRPGIPALLFLGPSERVHLLLLGLGLSRRRLQDHGRVALPAVDLCDAEE
jgi:hypothetical protein